MDKKQSITIQGVQLDKLISIGQQVRDFAADMFEDNHCTVSEALGALSCVTASFLCEFNEECPNTTLDGLKYLFSQAVDACLESAIDEEK